MRQLGTECLTIEGQGKLMEELAERPLVEYALTNLQASE